MALKMNGNVFSTHF